MRLPRPVSDEVLGLGAVVSVTIETPEQLTTITELGCDAASGYHLVRPVPASELVTAISASPFAAAAAPV